MNEMIALCNPCARAQLHQQKRARKPCSATLKHHISTQNEGEDFLATSIFQNFLRGWGHAGGHIGYMFSKGLGMLSSAEVANLLGDVGVCFPAKF